MRRATDYMRRIRFVTEHRELVQGYLLSKLIYQ